LALALRLTGLAALAVPPSVLASSFSVGHRGVCRNEVEVLLWLEVPPLQVRLLRQVVAACC
jgi:hypothetical protein